MDNLLAHKMKAIALLIEAVGTQILYLSPYSPGFNPIEHEWSQVEGFLRTESTLAIPEIASLIAGIIFNKHAVPYIKISTVYFPTSRRK